MNNSLLEVEIEEVPDIKPLLRQKQTELVKVIESIQALEVTPEWQSLKELLFTGIVEKLEKRLKYESLKDELQLPEIYRLQGQLAWARKYSDLNKLVEAYKQELNGVTKELNANAANRTSGS